VNEREGEERMVKPNAGQNESIDWNQDWDAIRQRADSFYRVVNEVSSERKRQDDEWGGTEHDDQHDTRDWTGFLLDQCYRTDKAAMRGDLSEYRERLVKVAALAIAAVESFDRKRPTQ
jgi:hypothetical protein